MMTKSAAILAGAMVVAAASPAAALGLKYGVRAGYGIGMPDPDKGVDSASVLDVGGAVMLDLAILGLEVDLLYNRQTTTYKGDSSLGIKSVDGVQSNIAIPVLARGSLPIIPMFLSLDFGGGLEPRFPIGATIDGKDESTNAAGEKVKIADNLESMYLYLPIFIGATLDLKLLTANLDIRYERQLTSHVAKGTSDAKDARFHELVFMAGVLF